MTKANSSGREVHVAVAVIERRGRILIARRPDHAHQGGLLEFPGGKVEPGETVQAALIREIAEETGLKVPEDSLAPVIGIRHDYGDKRVFLDVWHTRDAIGEAEGREGQPVDWLDPSELRDDQFPAANRPIIRALRLPGVLAISGPFDEPRKGLEILESSLAVLDPDEPAMVMLRAPDLSEDAYLAFAEQAVRRCRELGHLPLLHGPAERYTRIPSAAGIHLPWREARTLESRPVPVSAWFGVSCHDEAQLAHAAALGADFATLGPVLPTESHPGQPALGWPRFQSLVARATLPVYALGGLGPEDVPRARELGSQGVAGIRYWWRESD
ncbi:mutator MutT protein [Marinobacter santoriniensis NKSG1]|uniref:8-oxo-dGTP diphosphatase n=1 Tax=Marinobacter santoriniensis NKSG1 TaxID=1288826 RepID=M7DIM9_9GAMM|nr:Nudix family hydrolase [Marinobacter santoriniensis]EMP57522.1 mutator MutT protein [Marinobacter santoriniensis NKSG1]